MVLKIKKRVLLFSTAAIFAFPTISYAQNITLETQSLLQSSSERNEEIRSPRKDVIEWRYKTIDGKIYRRQYNYSKKKWIGEWERC